MKKGLIDLHIHTECSGENIVTTAMEVLRYCLVNGVETLSITDHDSAKGCREALKFIRNNDEFADIRFIPGVELTCDTASIASYVEKDGKIRACASGGIHILGYGIDPYYEGYYELEHLYSSDKGKRALGVYKFARRQLGLTLDKMTLEKVVGKSDTKASNILLRALTYGDNPVYDNEAEARWFLDNLKKADPVNFNAFLSRADEVLKTPAVNLDGFAKQDVYEMMDLIEKSGGVAVLAHPTKYRPKMELAISDFELLGSIVEELTKPVNKFTNEPMKGLVGIEMLHGTSLDEQFRFKFFDNIVKEKGLYVTGGSDSHIRKHGYNNNLGLICQNYYITVLDFVNDFDEILASDERKRNIKSTAKQSVIKNDFKVVLPDEILKGRCISSKLIDFEREVAGQLYYVASQCNGGGRAIALTDITKLERWVWLYNVYLNSVLENKKVLFSNKKTFYSWLNQRKEFFKEIDSEVNRIKAEKGITVFGNIPPHGKQKIKRLNLNLTPAFIDVCNNVKNIIGSLDMELCGNNCEPVSSQD